MNKKRIFSPYFTLLLLALFLSGCAETVKNMRTVPPDRIVTAPKKEKSIVVLSSYTDPTTGMEFVYVKGGCYQMGDTFGDDPLVLARDKPVHEVCVDDFYMGKYEVTQGEWQKIMGSNPSRFKKGNNYPVEKVSWNDTQKFIHKLNSRSGRKFTLPTEAQWEYAARSRGKQEKYAGSNSVDAVAWYYYNSGGSTHPVGQKQPNGLGLYDMSGNVYEWCSDWYNENYYYSSPRNNPQGPSSGSFRVKRSGSWPYYARSVLSVMRYGHSSPDERSPITGFRLALSTSQ